MPRSNRIGKLGTLRVLAKSHNCVFADVGSLTFCPCKRSWSKKWQCLWETQSPARMWKSQLCLDKQEASPPMQAASVVHSKCLIQLGGEPWVLHVFCLTSVESPQTVRKRKDQVDRNAVQSETLLAIQMQRSSCTWNEKQIQDEPCLSLGSK